MLHVRENGRRRQLGRNEKNVAGVKLSPRRMGNLQTTDAGTELRHVRLVRYDHRTSARSGFHGNSSHDRVKISHPITQPLADRVELPSVIIVSTPNGDRPLAKSTRSVSTPPGSVFRFRTLEPRWEMYDIEITGTMSLDLRPTFDDGIASGFCGSPAGDALDGGDRYRRR